MRAAEFLRALADTLDRAEQPAMTQSLAVQAQPVVVAMNPAGAPIDAVATQMSHIGTALDGDNFVPPLQQKIEIICTTVSSIKKHRDTSKLCNTSSVCNTSLNNNSTHKYGWYYTNSRCVGCMSNSDFSNSLWY